ncbi:hypothetical protein FKR81_19010 [Lentzea tibetensis]|uniref:Uncharacterized protein n=1 Tax=Lentzea tibetensis TaxID=2591470 RepID=A0A563ESS1_9PSEU|nr:hypothetical protein [Lentzea tibetensis]TWP50700.1 hypothetical protein FKR81_19010 [Lentzea tibetensis]
MRLISEAADRLLAVLAPKETAHADRYYCIWVDGGCGYHCGSGFPRLGMVERYCCYDDYTGRQTGCYDERINCNKCQ